MQRPDSVFDPVRTNEKWRQVKGGCWQHLLIFARPTNIYRNKLWRCLEDLGLQGRLVGFRQPIYTELKCVVKVGEE